MKLSGVTFNNRQSVLATMYRRPGHIAVVNVIETTYDGERAVKCVEEITGSHVGWIPKAELPDHPSFDEKMKIRIGYYKGIYYAEIENIEAPSRNMYFYVKRICKEKHIMMPVYDRDAYLAVIMDNRKK